MSIIPNLMTCKGIKFFTMFFGKVFSAAVVGFTALAGIATASVVPAPAFDIEPRAEVNSTQAGLDLAIKFQTNVNAILPKLVDYDRAKLDTTPVFDALLKYYDETTAAFSRLPPIKVDEKNPDPVAQKAVDVLNDSLNSVNAIVNILNPTPVNDKYAQAVVQRTEKLKAVIIIVWPWPPIIIIIVVRRVVKY
ncbi:hypothetical protein FRC03_003134 [Tulasnella sp. 419]|nr:hypothetical protein FRC03_003134 [Tulasnella sp. 419]